MLISAVLIMGFVLGCSDNDSFVPPDIPEPVENDPPLVYGAWLNTPGNTPLDISLEAHDPDDDPLTFQIDITPDHGTITVIDEAAWVYTPEEDFEGLDTFTFYANDGRVNGPAAEITITVGRVWYVRQDAGAAGDGLSWATAFKIPQAGVDAAAVEGGVVWVGEGIYAPPDPIPEPTPEIPVVTMAEGVRIYGGFYEIPHTNRYYRDHEHHASVLDGRRQVYHVVLGSSNARLDGFTITGGDASEEWPHNAGGGMLNLNCDASLVVANCLFIENNAFWDGGGMANHVENPEDDLIESSPLVQNCDFVDNNAYFGGGMANYGSRLQTTKNSVFAGNNAFYGGAMVSEATAGSSAGGSSIVVINCTFSGNDALDGAGIASYNNSSFLVINSIFWGYEAYTGNQILNAQALDPDEAPAAIIYSIVEGGYPGAGNIGMMPLFVEDGYWDETISWVNGNYHLRADSPGIDAAISSGAPAFDKDGRSRHDAPEVPNAGTGDPDYTDMGAYEFH